MKCKVLIAMFFVFLMVSYVQAAVPNFGNDGLQGLTESQIKEITDGKIIVTTSEPTEDEVTKARNSLITAVMIFEKPPEQVYELLYRSEDQIKFLPEIKDVKVINKSETQNNIEFKTRAAVFTFVYRVIHNFDKNNLVTPSCDSLDSYLSSWFRSFSNENILREVPYFYKIYQNYQEMIDWGDPWCQISDDPGRN